MDDLVSLRCGSMGSGKTFGAMVDADTYLSQGGVLATNFPLADNWAFHLSGNQFFDRFDSSRRFKRADDLWSRAFRISTPDHVYELSKRLPFLVKGRRKKKREGWGVLLLDEAQLYFNSRNWRDNFEWVQLLTQCRKLKWHVILMAHGENMIDSQIRENLIDVIHTHRNLGNVRWPFPVLRHFHISPIPVFWQIGKLSGQGAGSGMICDRRLYFLDMRVARSYNTDHKFNAFDAIADIQQHGPQPSLIADRKLKPSLPSLNHALSTVCYALDVSPRPLPPGQDFSS